MNKKYQKILNIKLLKSDKNKWGTHSIERIKRSFVLDDDNELSELKRFIKDEMQLLEREIKHFKKWSPKVYHKNVYISRILERRSLEMILKKLLKIKK